MKTGMLEWAAESLMLPGQQQCGDRHVVKEIGGGVLIAVIDGIGHGQEAAEAAEQAVTTIENNLDRNLITLVQDCHQALYRTRGVVMSLALLDDKNTMNWLGVGNVEGNLFRRNSPDGNIISMLIRQGIVGKQLPGLITSNVSVARNDLFVFTTDGISGSYTEKVDTTAEPEQVVHEIISKHNKGTDDALVLVGRYVG